MSQKEFLFPEIYSLPPFFTLQPVLNTRKRQLQLWSDLILAYCKHYNIYVMSVADATGSAGALKGPNEDNKIVRLFNNQSIQRKLNKEACWLFWNTWFRKVIRFLQKIHSECSDLNELAGKAEWQNVKEKSNAYVYWKTPEEWANVIYKWVCENSMNEVICTLFEIQQGDHTTSEEFYQINTNVLIKALKILESQRKAQILVGSDGEGMGVKFFVK